MKYFCVTILVLSHSFIQASIYQNLKNNVLNYLHHKNDADPPSEKPSAMRFFESQREDNARDVKSAQNKASILRHVRNHEKGDRARAVPPPKLAERLNKKIGREYYHMDPVLNELKRRAQRREFRRKGSASTDNDESSSLEVKLWKDEWDEHWMQKKFEALNSTQPRGDVVNMVAARPWGVSCGDPNQHDMPWGTCMLPAECDAEYRIYRGDYFCGRTHYICCALLLTNYDMYQGLDISFDSSSFATDSNEKKNKENSAEDEKKKHKAERSKRKRERAKRKRDIKRTIKKIVTEIRKILNRAWRNGTAQRKRKTKELKKFIETLKKQYRKDRKSVVNVHEYEITKIDTDLQKRLDQIQHVNSAFMSNDTFRDVVVNGTVNQKKLKMLLRTFPELGKLLAKGQRKKRRFNGMELDAFPAPEEEEVDPDSKPVILEYDLEYGTLYY